MNNDASFFFAMLFRAFFYLQALPIYLDKIFHPVVAVLLSVTFVLAFGEVQYFSNQICLHITQVLKQDIALIVTMLPFRLSRKLYAQNMGSLLVQNLWGLYVS